MTGFLILGFLVVFAYQMQKNVRTMSQYSDQIIHLSELNVAQGLSIEERAAEMMALKSIDSWNEFELQTLYPEMSQLRTRAHQFFGPLTLDGDYGSIHIFDWRFGSRLRQGFGMTWSQTVIWFDLQERLVPTFNLRPANLPLGVSLPQYQVVSIAGLDAAYRLESPSPIGVTRLFNHPSFIGELNAVLGTDKWHIDRYDDTLSICAFNRIIKPDEIPAKVEVAEAVVTLILDAAQAAEDELMGRFEDAAALR